MATEKIETYPQAARVIHLWLKDFCDESRAFPDMIAEAARRAAKRIEFLENLIEEAMETEGSFSIHMILEKYCD